MATMATTTISSVTVNPACRVMGGNVLEYLLRKIVLRYMGRPIRRTARRDFRAVGRGDITPAMVAERRRQRGGVAAGLGVGEELRLLGVQSDHLGHGPAQHPRDGGTVRAGSAVR